MLAFAFPDRVARNRGNGSFVLANGRGAAVEQTSALARAPYVAVGELTGTAASWPHPAGGADLAGRDRKQFADHIESADDITFDRGAMALARPPQEDPARHHAVRSAARAVALCRNRAHLRRWSDRGRARQAAVVESRQAMARPRDVPAQGAGEARAGPIFPTTALIASAADWLVPALYDKTSLKDFSAGDLSEALLTLLPWELRARLEREAPTHFEAPTGTMLAIDYEAEQGPTIAVRLQELFGLNTHPSIAKGKVPLVLELLSPAQRPVQVTRDLPGFWRGSYAAVRSDLRGRYPRHPWPEDPATALPTRRVKPRGT